MNKKTDFKISGGVMTTTEIAQLLREDAENIYGNQKPFQDIEKLSDKKLTTKVRDGLNKRGYKNLTPGGGDNTYKIQSVVHRFYSPAICEYFSHTAKQHYAVRNAYKSAVYSLKDSILKHLTPEQAKPILTAAKEAYRECKYGSGLFPGESAIDKLETENSMLKGELKSVKAENESLKQQIAQLNKLIPVDHEKTAKNLMENFKL